MKNIISLVLILCLLSVLAYAAELQMGVNMHACEGVNFVRMEERHAITESPVYGNLQWAYETIHQTNHFGEMAACSHLNGIGTDINAALSEMNLDLTACDYLIYDSFELQLTNDYAYLLENGGAVELRFDLNLERNVHPVVLLSNDQSAWKCVDPARVQMQNDGSLKVSFDELGTVLILVEMERRLSGGSGYEGSFTPSISGKAAPDIIAPDANDPATIALIYSERDELIARVPDEGYLVITPVSRRNAAEDQQVRQRLEWAYNQIQTTPRIGNLPATENRIVAESIDAVLDASGFADLCSDDMIVRDLFDASLYGTEYVPALKDEGHYIEIIFDLKVDPNEPLVILLTHDNQNWQVLDWSAYEINADGSVTLRLEQMGALAILVDAEHMTANGSAAKSPKTGEE